MKPVMLVILDGFGWREDAADNAVAQARKPNFDRLWAAGPRAFLRTCGRDVGLPDGQMGNSEVGHLNIGAGRVVMQELPRIDAAIEDGSLAQDAALLALARPVSQSGREPSGRVMHLLGLVSPGGVHAHQAQGAALARILAGAGARVVVHAIADGRDTPPRSAAGFLAEFEAALPAGARIGTLSGRYYAMDRDRRWERVRLAYDAIVSGAGPRFPDAAAAIAAGYAAGVSDEFLVPAALGEYAGMAEGDALVCFNFRADRVRQLLGALLDPEFDGFPRSRVVGFSGALGLTGYGEALAPRIGALFPPQDLAGTLGSVVAAAGLRQLRMAETEKYPHVTYFLNGGVEAPFDGEERIMVPSPKVATYDLQPEMSAPELAGRAVAAIGEGRHELVVLNFANPDMVGHTGSLPAAVRAVEAADAGLGRIEAAVAAQGGALLVTADHGNCETMRDPATGGPHTAHTLNRVPVLLAGRPGATLRDGRLADIAPTLLALLGVAPSPGMTGRSLLG